MPDNYEYCSTFAAARCPDPGGLVLDYGCGAGQIIHSLREAGYRNTFGCEVFYVAAAYKAETRGSVEL